MTWRRRSAVDPLAVEPAGGLRGAVAFLTPLGGPCRPAPSALWWFPVVGAMLGLALAGVWWSADHAFPPSVAAALVVGADLGVTGMLHFDGLLDSADGLLAHLDRTRRLQVMSGPEVGAFAVATGCLVVLLRWSALSSLRPTPMLMAGLWCAPRSLMVGVMQVVPYARPEGGLATAFLGGQRTTVALAALAASLVGVLVAFALAAGWRPLAGVAAVAAGLLAGGAVVALGRWKLGGFTGDVLGASAVVAETVGLVVAAARW